MPMTDRVIPKGIVDRLYRCRLPVVVALHIGATIAAFATAYAIRFEFDIPPEEVAVLSVTLPYLIIARVATYLYYGAFVASFRFSGLKDLWNLLKAQVIGTALLVCMLVFMKRIDEVSRAVIVLELILSICMINGIRFIRKFLIEFREINLSTPRKNVLVVGAGAAGVIILHEIQTKQNLDSHVVGFTDDDPHKRNTYIQGVPVLGKNDEIPELVKKYKIDEVIIAIPSAPYKEIMRISEMASRSLVSVKVLPGFDRLIRGGPFLGQLDEMKFDKILGRRTVKFSRESDIQNMERELKGKVVLVTGAGGSIGAEICMQAALFRPATLIAYERHENSLYELELEIREKHEGLNFVPIVGDILDLDKMRATLGGHGVDIVYHAAAYKHVLMMEREPNEAVRNNIFGTLSLIRLAREYDVAKVVLISTDKAVNPTSIMGATKRVAELMLQCHGDARTKMISVRFGNVLESNGSVIPIFKRQIAAGGPVTVTHPEVSRYFMSIPEAVQLVMTAGAIGQGGEIFLLDMGEPVKILDLAKHMIREAGLEPERDIEIRFTGLRHGEKLHEELYWVGEGIVPTENKKIMMLKPSGGHDWSKVMANVERLRSAVESGSHVETVELLKRIVPEAHISYMAPEPAALGRTRDLGGVSG